MPPGPGKYDDLCTEAREKAQAQGVILLIVDGNRGNGFACQATLPITLALPEMLEEMARQIREAHQEGKL